MRKVAMNVMCMVSKLYTVQYIKACYSICTYGGMCTLYFSDVGIIIVVNIKFSVHITDCKVETSTKSLNLTILIHLQVSTRFRKPEGCGL